MSVPVRVLAVSLLGLSSSFVGRAQAGDDRAYAHRLCRDAYGRKDFASARDLCQRSFLLGGNAEDLHHVVVATVDGPTVPRFDELVGAAYKAESAVKLAPREPWGYSARAHVAARVGDPDMLDWALADLRRIAPHHAETRAALALAAPGEPIVIWLGRALFVAALVGTLAHALVRRRQRRRRRNVVSVAVPAPLVLAALLAAGVVLMGGSARADKATPPLQQMSEVKIDPKQPEKSVPSTEMQNKKPIEFGYYLQDMLEGAQQAVQRGDHLAAAKFYLALTQAVPSRAYAFGRLCEQYEALGDRNEALGACRRAVTLEGPTVADFERLTRLIANGPQPLSIDARKELTDIQKHVASDAQTGATGAYVICQAAMALHDRAALEGCTATLRQSAPQDPRTISFEWALAMERGEHGKAKRLIERARSAGVPAPGLAAMETATRSIGPVRLFRAAAWGLVATAIILLALFGGRQFFQRRRATA